mmetsp:Transcript_1672/g.3245  ORF Transcript_1672/g.3245 Transcript_1672/m.3245 type:complete len:223 (-) Transcript_1672:134-802(-)
MIPSIVATATTVLLVLGCLATTSNAKLMQPSATTTTTTRNLAGGGRVGGYLFTMADCPGKCLTHNSTDLTVQMADCTTTGDDKMWELDWSCGNNKNGFFRIRNIVESLCIADPTDCAACHQEDIGLVDCDHDRAALFSYGNLHKTAPQSNHLYSARCWLHQGHISVLSTPSLAAKTCPQDCSVGACERLEWNSDHFSKDVLYYEWSFNDVRSECDADLLFNK